MIVIDVLMLKGGVGKTTICQNLGQALYMCGKKVLLIDNDQQHNLTRAMGIKTGKNSLDLSDLYSGRVDVQTFKEEGGIVSTVLEGLDIVPASSRMRSTASVAKKGALKELVQDEEVNDYYDVCLIDNPPSFSSNTEAAIIASDMFLLPTEPRQFSVDGLMEAFQILTHEYKIDPEDIQMVANMVEYNVKPKHRKLLQRLKETYPENFLNTYIPKDDKVDYSVTEKKLLFVNNFSAKCVAHFINLMYEITGFDEEEIWDNIRGNRAKIRSAQAKRRFLKKKTTEKVLELAG